MRFSILGLLIFIFLSEPTYAAEACASFETLPNFKHYTDKKIAGKKEYRNVSMYRYAQDALIVYQDMRVNADGAPRSYHPEDHGFSYICDGALPYENGECKEDYELCRTLVKKVKQVRWEREKSPAFCVFGFYVETTHKSQSGKPLWGGQYGVSSTIPTQNDSDPAPGYFISTTSNYNSKYTEQSNQRRYINSSTVPFIVIPGIWSGSKANVGDYAWVFNPRTGHSSFAMVADTGPNDKFGEGSIALHQRLVDGRIQDIGPYPNPEGRYPHPFIYKGDGDVRAKKSINENLYYVLFRGTADNSITEHTIENVDSGGAKAAMKYGGVEKVKACIKDHFRLR